MAVTISSNSMLLFMLLSSVEDSIGIMRVIVFFRSGVEMQMGLILDLIVVIMLNKIAN